MLSYGVELCNDLLRVLPVWCVCGRLLWCVLEMCFLVALFMLLYQFSSVVSVSSREASSCVYSSCMFSVISFLISSQFAVLKQGLGSTGIWTEAVEMLRIIDIW